MGIDSGKALRAVDDIQVQRFQTIAQSYEQFSVNVAKNDIACARDLYSQGINQEIKVPGKRFIEKIKWSEVDMEDDEYQLQIYPVSKLPNDPEGRLATVQEMMQAGLVSPEAGKRLLDYPDLEAEESLSNATLDYLHKILSNIVDEGKFTPPEPFDNLQKAKELSLEYYAQGKLNDLDEERLELLRKFMSQIDVLMQAAMPPPMAGPSMPGEGASPQAVPAAPPVSQLMPNAPNTPQ
jgi:hypothetical protein